MIVTEGITCIFMKAKVTPTAKASILVAMASISIVYGWRDGLQLPLASRDSLIIIKADCAQEDEGDPMVVGVD